MGRTLVPADEAAGAAPVVVIGEDVWRSRLAGDPDVLGRVIRVGGVHHTVVGVMPASFLFPVHEKLWLPLRDPRSGEPGVGTPLAVFGRLADGATEESAQQEAEAVERRVASAFPSERTRRRAEVLSFPVMATGGSKGGAGEFLGAGTLASAVALVLLGVACANVGLLIFARTATRASELAMRTALGATRARIVGQVFMEALVLAVLAAGLGLLLLVWLPPQIIGMVWSPDWGGMPWWFDFSVGPATVARAMVLAVVSAVLAAALPALRLTGKAVSQNLQRSGAGGWSVRFGKLSTGLIVADVAVAVAVVGMCVGVVATMSDASEGALEGVSAEEYLAVNIALPDDATPEADSATRATRVVAMHRGLVDRLTSEPGVLGVATADVLPRMDHRGGLVEVEGAPPGDHPTGGHDVERARVVPGFFEALGRPVVAGRAFSAVDLEGDRATVIVDSNFVERALGGVSPLGRRLRYISWSDREPPGPWHEIIGVVPALGTNLPQPEDAAGVYHAAAPEELPFFELAIHAAGNPMDLAPRVRAIASEVEPAATVTPPRRLDSIYPEDWYLMKAFIVGWSLFAVVLLALAGSGIYAIMSFNVAQRTRELGIRAALGARRSDIAATIGRRAALQLGVGALLGMPLAARAYFVIRDDPTATLSAFLAGTIPGIAIMLGVGVVACSAPMIRALRISPTEAMRGAD